MAKTLKSLTLDSFTLPHEPVSQSAVVAAWHKARQNLLAEQVRNSHWVGQLSTSALSTATAISAWSLVRRAQADIYARHRAEIDQSIRQACQWLIEHQNTDGGFGDTDLSHSNIATTLLVLAAWQLGDFSEPAHQAIAKAWAYCERVGKWEALKRRYGKDKTFVAPILTNCALAGIVAWDEVPTLPFEAAWLPQSWYRLARMPVVSYAVPALVAIGQAKFYHRPVRGPLGSLRRRAIAPTLQVLQRMQPTSGGYLEAVPLTSFVLMCLADMKLGDHPVAQRAVEFLLDSRLADGSLPIDTNLATWTTSLSITALGYGAAGNAALLNVNDVDSITRGFAKTISPTTVRWLLSCQHWSDHPFTGAQPGGWGWSNLSGAVPDADDTPAALLALAKWLTLQEKADAQSFTKRWPMLAEQIEYAAQQGLAWLLNLQNRDGGWPTFCRGWGKLPFDRSGSDLTAHALRAIRIWRTRHEAGAVQLPSELVQRFDTACTRGFRFLEKRQNRDGSWFPLWFGNQDRADEENPVYGTAKVLLAYADYGRVNEASSRGMAWLTANQNADGGWGGGISVPYRAGQGRESQPESQRDPQPGSSVEETGLALEALLACGGSTPDLKPTIMRGLDWIVSAVEQDHHHTSWPIGFYFAKLWYHERLYPIISATAALGAAVDQPELWQFSQ